MNGATPQLGLLAQPRLKTCRRASLSSHDAYDEPTSSIAAQAFRVSMVSSADFCRMGHFKRSRACLISRVAQPLMAVTEVYSMVTRWRRPYRAHTPTPAKMAHASMGGSKAREASSKRLASVRANTRSTLKVEY